MEQKEEMARKLEVLGHPVQIAMTTLVKLKRCLVWHRSIRSVKGAEVLNTTGMRWDSPLPLGRMSTMTFHRLVAVGVTAVLRSAAEERVKIQHRWG